MPDDRPDSDADPEAGQDADPDTDQDADPEAVRDADREADAADAPTADPAAPDDRRVAPYSAESTVDVDPVEPPDRREDESVEPDLPEDAIAEAERLTRLARRVPDEAETEAYRDRRADLLAEHGYAALLRQEGDDPTLVCHPVEWLDDEGTIDPGRIEAVGRAVEVPLGAAGDPDAWDAVAERNEAVVERIRAEHGDVHAANADAFATYVSNHHAKPIAAVTADELRWFREEYYLRNVWPTDEQRAVLDRSLALVYEELDVPRPDGVDEEG